jgi:hypothetical protein
MLHSDNTIYLPYEIKASEILEIWEYACSIATNEFEQRFNILKRQLRKVKHVPSSVRSPSRIKNEILCVSIRSASERRPSVR